MLFKPCVFAHIAEQYAQAKCFSGEDSTTVNALIWATKEAIKRWLALKGLHGGEKSAAGHSAGHFAVAGRPDGHCVDLYRLFWPFSA